MKIGVPKEIVPGETRVALVPDLVAKLVESGVEVIVESGAGEASINSDDLYKNAGASVKSGPAEVFGESDLVLKVQPPVLNTAIERHEVDMMSEGSTIVAFLQPLTNHDLVKKLAARKVTSFSMDAIPRIARAQKMDALTSMSSLSGYKAVLLAANAMARMLPLMMTAAGTYAPAKGLILGAGVAGLQALATGRRLGAVMFGYDVRSVVKEQVESLGATFLEAERPPQQAEDAGGYARELSEAAQVREREMLHRRIQEMDFVITTALIPGRPAPLLVSKEMVIDMRAGSVIVDMAAETGGNCELTMPGETVVEHGVTIIGPLNMPSSVPVHSSQMYARNLTALVADMLKDGALRFDFDDEVVGGSCITHEGRIVHGPTRELIEGK